MVVPICKTHFNDIKIESQNRVLSCSTSDLVYLVNKRPSAVLARTSEQKYGISLKGKPTHKEVKGKRPSTIIADRQQNTDRPRAHRTGRQNNMLTLTDKLL